MSTFWHGSCDIMLIYVRRNSLQQLKDFFRVNVIDEDFFFLSCP